MALFMIQVAILLIRSNLMLFNLSLGMTILSIFWGLEIFTFLNSFVAFPASEDSSSSFGFLWEPDEESVNCVQIPTIYLYFIAVYTYIIITSFSFQCQMKRAFSEIKKWIIQNSPLSLNKNPFLIPPKPVLSAFFCCSVSVMTPVVAAEEQHEASASLLCGSEEKYIL